MYRSKGTDLNHRSPVYKTGALTAKPQDLNLGIMYEKYQLKYMLALNTTYKTICSIIILSLTTYLLRHTL